MKRFISLCLVFLLIFSLSGCSCDIDWSKFDLTKHNFGLTEDKNSSSSDADIVSDGNADTAELPEYSEAVLNYIVPEKNGVVYDQWSVVASEDFRSLAEGRLMDAAKLISELSALKTELSDYSSVYRLAADEKFSRTLNNIRAWTYGAKNYPTEDLSEQDKILLETFVVLGTDLSEYGARFPSLLVTRDTETMGSYEDLIISQAVALDKLISENTN